MTYPSDTLANCEHKLLVNEGMTKFVRDEEGLCVILDAKNCCSTKALIHAGVHPNNIIITQADKKEYNSMIEEARELNVQLWNLDMFKALDFIECNSIKLLSIDSCGWWYAKKGKHKSVYHIMQKACADEKLANGCIVRVTVCANSRGALSTDDCIMDMLGTFHSLANEGQYMYQTYPADTWCGEHGMAYTYTRRGGVMVNMIGSVRKYGHL